MSRLIWNLRHFRVVPLAVALFLVTGCAAAEPMTIADAGQTQAIIVVAPGAGHELTVGEGRQARTTVERPWERRGADDLAHYLHLMTGAQPTIADTPEAIEAALKAEGPVFIVGEAALEADKSLQRSLDKVAKADPYLRADAVVVKRKGNRIYLAGTNDDSHYYAVSTLLQKLGCRWYLPTDIGEVVPRIDTLVIEDLDIAYAPPFEVRGYWISWLGDNTGAEVFRRRNFMNQESVPCGHRLATYTRDLAEELGVSHWEVPIAEDRTVQHVADKINDQYAAGDRISVGMEDGTYYSESPIDNELKGNLYDKYFLVPSLTDPFMVFYNKLCRELAERHPDSDAKLGFLAYVNLTLPPQRDIVAEPQLVCYVAPIDIDPIHSMDDEKSPPRQEYREAVYRWSKVMQGRVVIYDYDQGMLVWRSGMPNPSIQSFRHDVKHYRDAGILGVSTESRNAIGITFLNLHVRGQLLWNPDADVDELLAEFYPKFYGPAAEPMRRYWTAIYKAWEDTVATEHEYFVAPAIYTRELLAQLQADLEAAEKLVAPLAGQAQRTRTEQQYLDRMTFARASFDTMHNYMQMVFAASTDADYAAAAKFGQAGLAARETLADLNGTFTTYRRYGDSGYAWFPGEVKQYEELLPFTNGQQGELITRLPLEWAFRRDPNDTGLPRGYPRKEANLTYWHAHEDAYQTPIQRKDYPTTEWEMIRTDIYPQAQGVLHPDFQSFTGYSWYKTTVDLDAPQTQGKVHVRFPGLFAECWLYVNGDLVAHRKQNHMWWRNDYRFEWDVDVAGRLKAGENDITLRVYNTHHMSGMFRRPFVYRAK